jgi:pimeloyl-ACP methyl ester carboxylesterase
MSIDAAAIHFLDHDPGGTSLPLLVLHGNGGLALEIEISGLPGLLAGRRRVVVPDRPGYGQTMRPHDAPWSPEREAAAMAGLLDRLGIARAIVVGHSWGTFTALALAIAEPRRVAGLVLMSGYYFDDGRLDLRLVPVTMIPGIGPVVRRLLFAAVLRPFSGWAIRRIFAPNPVPPAFAAFPVALAARPSTQRAMAEDAAMMRAAARRMAPCYAGLAVPALVMTGSDDRMVDPAQASRLAKVLPDAALHRAEGVGHMIHHVATADTAAAIAGFAERLDAAR